MTIIKSVTSYIIDSIRMIIYAVIFLPVLSCSNVYDLDVDPSAPSDKKWHPGHYALVYDHRFLEMVGNPKLQAEFEDWVKNLPSEITGIQGGAYWCNLEKSRGVYDFRLLDIQLDVCRRYGKQLFCTIAEKQFNMPWSPAPEYISLDYDGVAAMTPSYGQAARIWDQRVLERFCLLIDSLGARFDTDPVFEGIEFMETSFSCDYALEAARGYKASDYVQAYKNLLNRTRKAFQSSVIIQEINFLPNTSDGDEKNMADFINYCNEIGVGIGGPDLFSDSQRNPKHKRLEVYDFFPEYAGHIPLASDVQYPEYACEMWYQGTKTWFGDFTPQGLLDMGINTLKLNYFFWCAIEKTTEVRFGFTDDVIPVLQKNNWPIHSGWPTN